MWFALLPAGLVAGCGGQAGGETNDACVVAAPEHLNGAAVPQVAELRALLARTAAGVADSLPSGDAAHFRDGLSDLDRALDGADVPAQCRSFNALLEAVRSLPATAASVRNRSQFELALDLTAASISARMPAAGSSSRQ